LFFIQTVFFDVVGDVIVPSARLFSGKGLTNHARAAIFDFATISGDTVPAAMSEY